MHDFLSNMETTPKDRFHSRPYSSVAYLGDAHLDLHLQRRLRSSAIEANIPTVQGAMRVAPIDVLTAFPAVVAVPLGPASVTDHPRTMVRMRMSIIAALSTGAAINYYPCAQITPPTV